MKKRKPFNFQEIIRSVEARKARVAGIAISPCPFCGEVAELRKTLNLWYVECDPTCNACGPAADTPEEAATLWNRRKV